MEIRAVEGELFHVARPTDGRKDGEKVMTKLKFSIGSFVNALAILLQYRTINLVLNRTFYNFSLNFKGTYTIHRPRE
jgi:hypothetical protein